MSKVCIINKETRECVDILYDTPWVDTEELTAAPQNDGEVGWFWNENGWKTFEEWCEKHRQRRDKYLSIYVDEINPLRWDEMSEEQKEKLKGYRRALLGIPQQPEFPRKIVWPEWP